MVKKVYSKLEIDKYLYLIVSGEKYGVQEGLPYFGGSLLVSFEQLRDMVDKGDNIIWANYLEDKDLILIEYESYRIKDNNNLGRGR